jgi:hypothetical protein
MFDNCFTGSALTLPDNLQLSLEATPHNMWLPIEAQDKINLALGSSADAPVMKNLMRIEKCATRNYFYSGAAYLATLPANWYAEKVGGLCPYYSAKGTWDVPQTTTYTWETVSITDKAGQIFAKLLHQYQTDVDALYKQFRVALCIEYDDYQMSDPVWRGYYNSTTGSPVLEFSIHVDLARMNKNITAFVFYTTYNDSSLTPTQWSDVDSEYIQNFRIPINNTKYTYGKDEYNYTSSADGIYWGITDTDEYCFRLLNYGSGVAAVSYSTNSTSTLAGMLNHASDTSRSYLTPRYLIKSSRSQASISIVDQDDTTLRLSCYDGAGAHEDDNYPDVAIDSNNLRQRIALLGRGSLLGIGLVRDTICAFRNTEIETFDLQSGVQGIIDADFCAKYSLVRSDWGLTWAGRSAIYILPEDGSGIQVLNPLWKNKYDGSLLTDSDAASYVTDAYRKAIISGYDPFDRTIWFQIQQTKKDNTGSEYVLWRYHFDLKRWTTRVLGNAASTKYFARATVLGGSSANKLILGTSAGIIQYPLLLGDYRYQDFVTSADASAGIGYETYVWFNVEDFNSLVKNGSLLKFLLDINGSSITTLSNLAVAFYANDETTAFDTQYIPIDQLGELRNVAERGNIKKLNIKITTGTSGLSDFKKMDISRMLLGYTENVRKGN